MITESREVTRGELMENVSEQNWKRDSDMVFTAVSTGYFDDYKMAERAVVMLYVHDMSVSRAGISHALKRLERFYAERSNT